MNTEEQCFSLLEGEEVLALDSGDDEGLTVSYSYLSVNSVNRDTVTDANTGLGIEEVVLDSQPTLHAIPEGLEPINNLGTGTSTRPKGKSKPAALVTGRNLHSPPMTRAKKAANKTPM